MYRVICFVLVMTFARQKVPGTRSEIVTAIPPCKYVFYLFVPWSIALYKQQLWA